VTGPLLASSGVVGGVQDDNGVANISYNFNGITAGSTQLNLLAYTPSAPVIVSDTSGANGEIQLTLNGAFQVTDATSGSSPTSFNVKLYDTNGDLLWEQDVSAASEPTTGIWNGLALTYSLTADLWHDASGKIIGVNGSYAGPLNILQNFWQPDIIGPLDSSTVEIW
jgi:hypothetical protein